MGTKRLSQDLSPAVDHRVNRLKVDHAACVKARLAEGQSVADAHAMCAHIERQITALVSASVDLEPDPTDDGRPIVS
jgi:hypothetical protein